MTRPDLRTPRPGELLRAATSKRATPPQSLSATPWAGNTAAAGLRALDREMIYLDEKAAQSVAEARAEIAQAQEDLGQLQSAVNSFNSYLITRLWGAEGDITAAEAALTDLEDVQLPALRGRLDDAEYDVKHISAEWITGGTIDTARLNAVEIASAAGQFISLDVSQLVALEGTIDTAVINELWSEVVVAKFLTATEKIITEDVIATGAVTASALNVVSTSGTGHSWRLDETGLIAMHTSSQEAMHIDSGGLRMWDTSGNLTVRINGAQNFLAGEFRTALPSGGQGAVISSEGSGLPGLRFTSTGTVDTTSPGIQMTSTEGLWIQGADRMRYSNGRFATVTGSITNQRGGSRGPGQLAYSVQRSSPVRIAVESLYADIEGIYTVTFLATLSVRPTSSRAFMQIYRNAGAASRSTFGQEGIGTASWTGWCNAGDRFDFTTYFDGTGSYVQGTTINVLYHGR